MSEEINFKVQAGMICSYDPENVLKQRDSEISHVLVIKREKFHPFNKSIWIVQNVDDPHSDYFTCPEFLLKPMNVSIIRIPSNIPDFNDADLDSIEYAYKVLSTINIKFDNKNDMNKHERHISRLKAIHEKIKFCKEMRDV